jgi:mono/diheme cytochrome c family protein
VTSTFAPGAFARGAFAWGAFAVVCSGCAFLRGYAEGTSAAMPIAPDTPPGLYRLAFDDFHGLNTDTMARSAVPWKLLAAALVDEERTRNPTLPVTEESAAALLSHRFGFLRPGRIANWPSGSPPPPLAPHRPLGLVAGMLTRSIPTVALEVVNTGCSTCHAATLYDAEGNPTGDAWIGLPSSSINIGRYARDVFVAFQRAVAAPDELLATIRTMFPAASPEELATIRKYVLPQMAARLPKLAATIGGFTPYSNGSPGLVNGVGTIKLYLGLLPPDRPAPQEIAFTGIPELGGLRWKSSILADGVCAPPGWKHGGAWPGGTSAANRDALAGVAALVTVGTLGVDFPVAAGPNRPSLRDVVDFLVDGYRSPAYPGPLDVALADQGAEVYAHRCERCHGRYAPATGPRLVEFPNRLIPVEVIDTDPARVDAVTEDVTSLFKATALGPRIDPKRTGAYVASPLGAVWATAPYLHNGSVPTLWHLMHPEARPACFEVGGHKLDFARVGIAGDVAADGVYRYPPGYRPWSLPEVYDARLPGRSNRGHEEPFDEMNEGEKRAVLEFLKRL